MATFEVGEHAIYLNSHREEKSCIVLGYDEEKDVYLTDIKHSVPVKRLKKKALPAVAAAAATAEAATAAASTAAAPGAEAQVPAEAPATAAALPAPLGTPALRELVGPGAGPTANAHDGPGASATTVAAATTALAEQSQNEPPPALDAFANHMMERLRAIKSNTDVPQWEQLQQEFAPTMDKLAENLVKARATFPFIKEEGVNYAGFQNDAPSRSKGHAHTLFFNVFLGSSFPAGIYWSDVALCVENILRSASFKETVSVFPVPNSLVAGRVGHQGHGVLGYGADGGYVNGVHMCALSALMFLAVADVAPAVPSSLVHDIAAVSVSYVRHTSSENRCVHFMQQTATKAALNRPLDPFMIVQAITQCKTTETSVVNDIIKRYNGLFFANPKLQLKGKAAMRIKSLLSEESTPPANRALMQRSIAAFGWTDGPWNDSKLDFEGLYVGKLARELSHPDWMKLFTASTVSQRYAILWNNQRYEKGPSSPDAAAFVAKSRTSCEWGRGYSAFGK